MRSAITSGGRAFGLLGAFVAISVVAGVLLAGLALPAAWATGSATRGGVDFFNSLPAALEEPPLPEQSSVLDSKGRVIARFYDERRSVVPLSKISMNMRHAIISIEDSRFYQHGGVDPQGLLRAFVNNRVTDGQVQGASTLTQQYIKLRILEAATARQDAEGQVAALSQNYTRKLQEVRLAVSLEKKKPKDEILEDYLNIANFGDSTYGVEAAAEYFFNGTTAKDLTVPQAALLAGLVQSPQRYNPFDHPEAATNRRNIVLDRMYSLQVIDQKEYQEAKAAPLGVEKRSPRRGCITSHYAYFCSYVRNLIVKSDAFAALGDTPDERANALDQDGLVIRTTLDADIQEVTQNTLDSKVPQDNSAQIGAASVTVEPGTGKVLAMAQNRTYDNVPKVGRTEINYSVDQQFGSGSGFQVGSTFKPFTLAAWLADNKGLYDLVDASREQYAMSDFKSCQGRLAGAPFPVHNAADGEGSGAMTVLNATTHSVNLAYMDMASKISLCDLKTSAEKLGVHIALPRELCIKDKATTALPDCTPSLVLGAVEVAPLTMAAAYAGFAADGTYCDPIAVTSITDRNGGTIKVPAGKCKQAIPTNVARGVTYALKTVLTSGTAAGSGIGRPAAGKTGTTDNSVDTWFVGYTPQRSTAVWVGDNPNPQGKEKRVTISHHKLGSRSYGTIFGGTLAAPIWQTIMKTASKGLPAKDWARPTGKVLSGSSIPMPDVHGLSVDAARGQLTAKGFRVSIGEPVDSPFGPGQVESTSPPGGSRTAPGSTVVIHPGNGQGQGQGDGQGGDGQGGQNGPGGQGPGDQGPGGQGQGGRGGGGNRGGGPGNGQGPGQGENISVTTPPATTTAKGLLTVPGISLTVPPPG